MAGIYVHIPFCRKACHYCNFHFSTSFNKKDELIDAILQEIILQAHYLEQQTVDTIYFGGGTPSALATDDLNKILKLLQSTFQVNSLAEITLEANPDDVNDTNLNAWRESGFNRLSIGIQAFQDNLLKDWNRSHDASQALEAIGKAQQHGYHNITADLIYGGIGLSDEEWIHNIRMLIDSGIPHISAYALTVEPGTVLAHRIQKGKSVSPDDDQSNRQYSILQSMLRDAGYEQYEVSNFAKPGFHSKHNTSYWNGIHYLGIGPSAHSFNGISRQWNISNNVKYTHSLRNEIVPFEIEILNDAQRYNEMVMTGLRTSSGINIEKIRLLENGFEKYLESEAALFLNQGKIYLDEQGNYVLKPEYYFFADGIASELFFEQREKSIL